VPPEFSLDPEGMWVRLDRDESAIFRRLVAEMRTLLTTSDKSDDLIKGRLFPPAYEEAEYEQSYRAMVGDDLQKEKLETIETVARLIIDGDRIDVLIPENQINSWLTLLTDMRLAIGTRLDVDEEMMSSEPDLKDPNAPAVAILHWLGWMQEMILEELTGSKANEGGTWTS
jgi:hypothetical protein